MLSLQNLRVGLVRLKSTFGISGIGVVATTSTNFCSSSTIIFLTLAVVGKDKVTSCYFCGRYLFPILYICSSSLYLFLIAFLLMFNSFHFVRKFNFSLSAVFLVEPYVTLSSRFSSSFLKSSWLILLRIVSFSC